MFKHCDDNLRLRRLGKLCSLTLAIGLATQAAAETNSSLDAPANTLESATITYPASYFSDYSPVSVNDMVNLIPGVGLALSGNRNSSRRGLGAGENEILINGQRMTGKSNSGRDQLSRIPANQVEYIEIIRGDSKGLAVRNSGQTLNIVLMDAPSRQSINTEINADYLRDGTVAPGGKFSISGQNGQLSYLLSAEAEPRYNHETRSEFSLLPNGQLNDTVFEEEIRDQTEYQVSGAVGYQLERDLVQLNGIYGERNPPINTQRLITTFGGAAPVETHEREARQFNKENWEIGGDWERSFGNGSTYRLLFIVNDDEGSGVRERYRRTADSEDKDLYLYNMGRDRERIVRTSYTFSMAQNQGLELGVERAQTIRNNDLRMGLPLIGAPSDTVGGLVPVSIPNSTSQVEEMRYETFSVHNWQLNDRMSLESTLLFETSKIAQTGDVSLSRNFDFWKPKVVYRFDITSLLQLRTNISRNISQLSFSDFSASVDNSDVDKNIEAGNPEIMQQKAWNYSLNLEYRLPSNVGVLSSGVYYHDIEDVIDRVDVSSGSTLQSARGNIGDAERYGVNLYASTKLGFLGLPEALLTTGLRLTDSSVVDPFLGNERRISGHGRGFRNVGFRHDLPPLSLNYGFNWGSPINGGSGQTSIDIDDIEVERYEPNLSLFLEKMAFGGTTFRFEAMNTLDAQWCGERTRFDGATADGIVEEIEEYCSGSGRRFALKIRRTF